MASLSIRTSMSLLFSILSIIEMASAHPLTALSKRSISRGASAGLGLGIAIASAFVVVVSILLVLHFRQKSRVSSPQRQHSAATRIKRHNSSATTTLNGDVPGDQMYDVELVMNGENKQQPEPTIQAFPRRQKSIKDRLMGPLYRDSHTDLPSAPLPTHIRRSRLMRSGNESENALVDLDAEFITSENHGKRSTVDSFSSRRATRLMMYM